VAAFDISLLGGWLPLAMGTAAVTALVVAVGWRDRTWRTRTFPVIAGAAVLIALLTAKVAAPMALIDPLPLNVWVWFGLTAGALLVLVFGWKNAHWWRRLTAVLAPALALLMCANGLNQFVGYYPTVGAAIAGLEARPIPGQVSLSQLHSSRMHGAVPRTGTLVAVDIPSTTDGFTPRQELVYLPPVWFRGPQRPVLPAVEMIGAEVAASGDWVRLGDAVRTSDAYASSHGGQAPILVFVDATGAFHNDTECVNGPQGSVEDYLVKDVPRFITTTFGASRDPRRWGVVGWSMGGTCAIGLTVEHPSTFGRFVDISGDLGPNTGNKAQTIAHLYGGSVAAWDAHDPSTVMARHGRYSGVSGRFVDGSHEHPQIEAARQLANAAQKVDIPAQVVILPGEHVWQFAATAFADSLPWLCAQLGLSDRGPRTSRSTTRPDRRPPSSV
jgi:enterochelin esterase-like enzyme